MKTQKELHKINHNKVVAEAEKLLKYILDQCPHNDFFASLRAQIKHDKKRYPTKRQMYFIRSQHSRLRNAEARRKRKEAS